MFKKAVKVSILTDNYPGRDTRAEHGLSYLIEHKEARVLFDTGQSDLFTTDKPYNISDTVLFLGEIHRITDFESRHTSFSLEDGTPDFVPDDSAITISTEHGLFVITGCGHAGIVNTLEHAKSVTGENRIYGLMGGFHLRKDDRQTMKHLLPSHCAAFPALARFFEKFNIKIPKTGDVFVF